MARAKQAMSVALGIFVLGTTVLFSLAPGCSRPIKARPGITARWERQLGWPTPAEKRAIRSSKQTQPKAGRKVAGEAPKCLKDRLSLVQLQAEVARIEAERGSMPVQGRWQDKALALMKPTQAKFLNQFSNWIASQGVDFSDCSELPCILSRIYGKSETRAGWKIYYWFLRMGYGASLKNFVPDGKPERPDANPSDFRPYDFLFSDSELDALVKLSWLLPDAYRSMASLQTLHRVPAKWQPTPTWSSGSCSDFWGGKGLGFIRLKRCLDTSPYEASGRRIYAEGDDSFLPDNGLLGQFNLTLTHELTHALDHNPGGMGAATETFSDQEEWKSISGWYPVTVVGPLGADETIGVLSHQWKSDESKEGFVRSLASGSPAEDFAETAAWVRFRPSLANARTPKKSTYHSTKFFGGRTFDVYGLQRFYEDKAFDEVSSHLEQLVSRCASGPTDRETQECIATSVNRAIDESFDQSRATEWEACDVISASDFDMRARIVARLNPEITEYLVGNLAHVAMTRSVRELSSALVEQVDPREAYIHCFKQRVKAEGCYRHALGEAFDEVAKPFTVPLGERLLVEREAYLNQNPMSSTVAAVHLFFGQILSGIEPKVRTAAEERWKSCMQASAPKGSLGEDRPLLEPFSGGKRYVATQVLNCINGMAAEDVKTVRDRFLSRLGLSTANDVDVQALIQELLFPIYLDVLEKREEQAAIDEDLDRAKRKPGVIDVLVSELVANLDWAKASLSAASAIHSCIQAAQSHFDDYFSRVHPSSQLSARFESLANVRTGWSRDACDRAVASPVAKGVIEQNASRAWIAAIEALQSIVAVRADELAKDCVARNLGISNNAALKAKRRACLIGNVGKIEELALADWESSESGRNLSSRKVAAKQLLAERRKDWLAAAAKKAFDSH